MRKFVLLLVLLPGLCLAGLEQFDFVDEAEEKRFRLLINEIRCLVCQNQSLGDSDAGLAHDLRMEVYDQMRSGKDDDAIIDFLVERYGDFVLYEPPVKPSTWFLWYGPGIVLLVALVVFVVGLRRRQASRESDQVNEQQRARAKALLDDERDAP